MSKGSTRRPSSISDKELSQRWEAAFGGKAQTPARAVLSIGTIRNLLCDDYDTVAKVIDNLHHLYMTPGIGARRLAEIKKWLNDRPLDSDLEMRKIERINETDCVEFRALKVKELRQTGLSYSEIGKIIGSVGNPDKPVTAERARNLHRTAIRLESHPRWRQAHER